MNPFDHENFLSRIAAALTTDSHEARKRAAWAKAKPAGLAGFMIAGQGDEARQDDFGNLMLWSKYGDHASKYGWEIDHQLPSSLGGSDEHQNLRALNCKANRTLGGFLGAMMKGQR